MLPLGCRRHLGLETPFWYNCHMAVLNLRGVPDELAQRLKADAALAGVSLRDYCVRLLSGRGVEGSMIDRTCERCGTTFSIKPSALTRGRGRFCSNSCAASVSSLNRDQTGAANPNWSGGVDSAERKRRYKHAHPERHAAHAEMTKAIRSGRLIPQPCEKCGEEKVEGHHDDYSRPLSVRWLCKKHHLEAHGGRLDNGLSKQVSSPAAPTKPCDDCGALIGHQKWCKSRR